MSKPKRPTDRHNQRLSGWHISSLPPKSNISHAQTNPPHDLAHWSIFDQPHSTSSHANLESPTLDFLPNNRNDVSARAVSQSNAPNTHDTPSCSNSNSSYIDLRRAQEHRELIEAIKAPAIKPPIFPGDLIDYPRWKKAFNAFLGQSVYPSASDKLYYLDQYTSGQVGEVIQSYIYLDTETAFVDAMNDIDRLYGNSFFGCTSIQIKAVVMDQNLKQRCYGYFQANKFSETVLNRYV